ncbi:protein virilizer homolog isoform X1 [Hordeum vulgare subsp. vulgare]|uniref:protein virilizer homolog isoform X1 n=1 Tax=Hordeum vulgare subsp. vulgare TaxID=112509 RepID=UPI001D1A42C9|nr:protein virilizer homolog isoform X1 [Hordeum vulgare subsp. vulgare]
MGRPEPVVLFAQTILHSQLDEYVDEVLFSEPVVITACEFLEQNASPSTPNISLVGATSPPSFALEVFVHCDGESRFRRLCLPFLYSHSSSNVLEVEAIVTNHLVLRGTYRSLTLVIYGNTAEDLGQFNIELGLDHSLANVVSSPSEGKFEDLPPALRSSKFKFEESLSSIKPLSFQSTDLELSLEVKKILYLALKMHQILNVENLIPDLGSVVISAVSKYVTSSNCMPHSWNQDLADGSSKSNLDPQESNIVHTEASNELFEIWKNVHSIAATLLGDDGFAVGLEELPTTKTIFELFNNSFPYYRNCSLLDLQCPSQNNWLVMSLSLVLLICSSKESCFYFVDAGGMEQIINLLCWKTPKSTATTLLLLGIVENATRHGVGCEAFLGWWPRSDRNSIPTGSSDGYCSLLKLLLEKERHDIASRATYVLQRLRFYEILSRYESAVIKVVSNLPSDELSSDRVSFLIFASNELAEMSKLIKICGPIEDPSPEAIARRISKSSHLEDSLSFKATIGLITSSKYSFLQFDTDSCLLSLIQERGFFPLSAALLSSPVMHLASGPAAEILMEITSSIESILLSLLFCRSGLSFLLSQPEATELIVLSLQDGKDMNKTECITLRHAFVLLSKGFFCRPQEVGMITELHLKVGSAANRLLAVPPNSDELLWVLWELCAISRSDSGRQALLALGYFPEAISVLLSSISSYKDLDSTMIKNGGSPLGLAIFHSAAEILEVLVADSTASSLKSWIGFAVDLHKALHSSSPGSNRKDAPTRLLEWIDAGVIYQRNGAVGLLRYSAILASGEDAHFSSGNVLVSDSMDVENVVADSNNTSDGQVIDNLLGKLVTNKYFDGVALCSTSVVQLTTAFRILAFISEDKAVASSLFEEGAITVIYIVLMNCKSMLERLSNSYDYLVDEGAELSSTTELLLDRTHEQALVDLMTPSLVLLINLLQILHGTKEQYRNKKLLTALLRLHKEVSPRLAACAADLSFMFPSFAVSFGVVCQLITSALACWPLYNWTPGLFHCLLENVEPTNASVPLGPKDACSLLCLLGDLFPDEGIWMWNVEVPSLSAIRSLSTATVLGPQVEKQVNWHLRPEHVSVLLVRLMPQLDRLARVIDNFATSALMVIQDMLRIFIVRVASEKVECAVVLLRPIFIWLNDKVDGTSLSEGEVFKVHQLLKFITKLSEHPNGKVLLWKMGIARVLNKLLKNCSNTSYLEDKMISERGTHRSDQLMLKWRIPLFRCLASIFSAQPSGKEQTAIEQSSENASVEECSSIMHHLLLLCQVLPVGREMLACSMAFKEVASSYICRTAVPLIFSQLQILNQDDEEKTESDTYHDPLNMDNWRCFTPLLKCFKQLLKYVDANNPTDYCVETVYSFILGAIALSQYGDSLEGLIILRCLFGHPFEHSLTLKSSGDSLDESTVLVKTFEEKISQGHDHLSSSVGKSLLNQQVQSSITLLCSILENAGLLEDSVQMVLEGTYLPFGVVRSVVMTSRLMPSLASASVNHESVLFFSNAWKVIADSEEPVEGEFSKRLVWELPDSSLDRQLIAGQSASRKLALGEAASRRIKDNQTPEPTGQFARSLNTTSASTGHARRDTFRHRKPNTSRPPSMHVDDYVARERNIDGASSASNIVNSTPRGTLSGRPPSIHVDEFMARQRERQNPVPVPSGDAPQVKSQTSLDDNVSAKAEKPRQPKADLDDDQEIDIVFDEESEPDDKLPFPQPDDNLPPPVIIGENSPGPVVEETENQQNEKSPFSQREISISKNNESLGADISSRTAMPPEANVPLERKGSVSSPAPEKRAFSDHADEPAYFSSHNKRPAEAPLQQLRPNTYQKRSAHKLSESSLSSGSHGHDHRFSRNQPPLPPMPLPTNSMPTRSPESSQRRSTSYNTRDSARDGPPAYPSNYPLQPFEASMPTAFVGLQAQTEHALVSNGTSSSNAPNADVNFLWNNFPVNRAPMEHFSSGSSARPMAPLAQPYSTPHSAMSSGSPASHLYNQGTSVVQPNPSSSLMNDANLGINSTSGSAILSSFLPTFATQLLMGRPPMSSPFFGTSLQQVQLSSGLAQTGSNPQPSVSSVQARPPPPPPLPQQPHPSQTQQHLASLQWQQHQEQPQSYAQNSIQSQMTLQFQNQLPVPQMQFYPSQQEFAAQTLRQAGEQSQVANQTAQADGSSQQQREPEIDLNQFFSSPEAIQSLLSDRAKLCQLLEANPKLMQMLQERIGGSK